MVYQVPMKYEEISISSSLFTAKALQNLIDRKVWLLWHGVRQGGTDDTVRAVRLGQVDEWSKHSRAKAGQGVRPRVMWTKTNVWQGTMAGYNGREGRWVLAWEGGGREVGGM